MPATESISHSAVTAVFAASADQVRHARRFAEAMLAGWPVVSDVVLVVSELATNAAVHSASRGGGKVWVHLEAFPGDYVWIEVRDEGGPWTPRDECDGRAHGLDIVSELAADSGVDGDPHTGWIAWARLDLPRPCAAAVSEAAGPRTRPPAATSPHLRSHDDAAP